MDTQNPTAPAQDDSNTPNYGDFGGKESSTADGNAPEGRSGSNDNPDEFSEIRNVDKAKAHPDKLEDQPGHVVQNQDPEGVRAAQESTADSGELRQAWSKDDPRYAGGGSHNATYNETPEKADHNAQAANKSTGDQA